MAFGSNLILSFPLSFFLSTSLFSPSGSSFLYSSTTCVTGFLFASSLKLGSRNLQPRLTNNTSIPAEVLADVSLKIAPISSANFLALSSGIFSLANKSLLFAAKPITIYNKKKNI